MKTRDAPTTGSKGGTLDSGTGLAGRGENDFLFSLQELAELREHLPEAHLMNVPFASHEAISEQPGIMWAAMKTMYGL